MRTARGARSVLCILTILAISATLLLLVSAPAFAATPHISSLSPNHGAVGSAVGINGTGFGTTQGVVLFNVVPATVSSWTDTLIIVTVPTGAATGDVTVVMAAFPPVASNSVVFTVNSTPVATQTWYLAEGSTNYGFDTYIMMENTTTVDATVNIIYDTTQYGLIPRPQALNVPPNSRITLHVNDDIPNVDLSTEVISSQKIVVERSIYWNNRIEGTDSIGVTQTSKQWFLAEGCTTYPFETWVLIQNPSATTAANVNMTYMTSKGVITKGPFSVGAGQRKTIDVFRDVGACDVSTMVASDQNVVCERSMYWSNRRGGHDSVGVTATSKTWYMAEGSTAWGFDTWLLLQNPNSTAAKVNVTYMTKSGPVNEKQMTLEAKTRKTIHVNDKVPNTDTSIAVSSNLAINAERAMYWDNGTGKAGTDTVGMKAASNTIYLAEGTTAWGFETFVCIQNPNSDVANVTVTYMTNNGPVDGGIWKVPANSRVTINVNTQLNNQDTSIKLTSDNKIMAERAMYWNNRGGGHCSIGWAP